MFSHVIKLYHRLLRWANQNYNFHFCFFLSSHGIFCSYLSLYFSNIPTSLHLHSHHPIPSHCLPLPEPWQGPLTSLLTFSHIYIPTVTFLLKSLYCFLTCCLIKHERLTSTSKTLWIQLLTTFWSSFQVLYSVFILCSSLIVHTRCVSCLRAFALALLLVPLTHGSFMCIRRAISTVLWLHVFPLT